MVVEWQDYAPAPPVRIEVGPAKKRRVEPRTVCGDRPRDVIPQVPGADALALNIWSGDGGPQGHGTSGGSPPAEEPEQWMGRRVRFKGGCDMALAFPQFARDEGLVCAVDDDGDSLVCWDSCPWNPMTVYASQLERVEAAEPEGNNDEEPNDEQPED